MATENRPILPNVGHMRKRASHQARLRSRFLYYATIPYSGIFKRLESLEKSVVLGAQVIARASQLLRLVARNGTHGVRLVDLARAANLSQPTARRLLKALTNERLLEQPVAGERYFVGPLAYELGMAARAVPTLTKEITDMALRIANLTTGRVCIQALVGPDVICLHSVGGNRSLVDQSPLPGDRRPLGGGAGPMAILAKLDNRKIKLALEEAESELYFSLGLDLRDLLSLVSSARINGFSICPERFGGSITGVARAFECKKQGVSNMFSVSILLHELDESLAEDLASLLKDESNSVISNMFKS